MRTVFLTIAVLLATSAPAAADFTRLVGHGSAPGQCGACTAIALAPDGSLYVSDWNPTRIQRFAPDGSFLGAWGTSGSGPGQFSEPSQIAVSSGGDVYVTDTDNNRVQRFSPDGEFLSEFGNSGPDAERVHFPRGLAIDTAGNAFVGDAGGSRIVVYDVAGNFVRAFGTHGTGPGQFSGGSRYGGPWTLTIRDGVLYVLDGRERVQRFDLDGTYLGEFGSAGQEPGRFWGAWAMAPDLGGVTIGDATGRLQRFTSNGELRDLWQAPETSSTFTPQWRGLAVASGETYYAVALNAIYRVTPTPTASILGGIPPVLTGREAVIDARHSSAPFRTVAFSWDLDGDRVFERHTGSASAVRHAFATPGRHTVHVRVTTPDGLTADASEQVDVRPAPPPGPVGLSILAGATYTRTPLVSLSLIWPPFETHILVSNDGGFANAARRPVSPFMTWRLTGSGPERLPKTVYARFGSSTQTFSDDVILDQTAPKLLRARALQAGRTTATVRLKARDAASGVHRMQVTANRRKPGAWKSFSRRARTKLVGRSAVAVRLRDRAGNVSKWRRVRVQRS